MNRRARKKCQPTIEAFESRTLLSALPAASPPPVDVAPTIYPPPLLVSGNAQGTYSLTPSRRGAPAAYQLRGSGVFLRMDQVDVTARFPVGAGPARVTLSNRDGVVELELTRTSWRPGTAHTALYQFRVTRATGRYAALMATGGIAELSLSRVPRRGTPTFTLNINPVLPA